MGAAVRINRSWRFCLCWKGSRRAWRGSLLPTGPTFWGFLIGMASLLLSPGQIHLSFDTLFCPAQPPFEGCDKVGQTSHGFTASPQWTAFNLKKDHFFHHCVSMAYPRTAEETANPEGEWHGRKPFSQPAPTQFSPHHGLCSRSQPLAQGPGLLAPSSRLLEKKVPALGSEGSPAFCLLPEPLGSHSTPSLPS